MFGTTPVSDTHAPPSTAPFLPIYNGPEEDPDLIGFVQEHDPGFEAFDIDKVLLGRFAAFSPACDAIWADCLGVRPRPGQLRAAVAAAIAAYEKSGRMVDAALAWAAHGFPIFPVTVDKIPVPARDRDANGKPIPGTGSFKKATTDPIQIRAWWRQGRVPDRPADGLCVRGVLHRRRHLGGSCRRRRGVGQDRRRSTSRSSPASTAARPAARI